jgi:uncharacterized cupin superfamily protein
MLVMGEVNVEGWRDKICLGFDGSESDDHTVLFGCREDGNLFTIGYWTPEPGDFRWRDEVNEDCRMGDG